VESVGERRVLVFVGDDPTFVHQCPSFGHFWRTWPVRESALRTRARSTHVAN
jgi:hypothetical protein